MASVARNDILLLLPSACDLNKRNMVLVKIFIGVALFVDFSSSNVTKGSESDGVVAGIFNSLKDTYCDGVIIKSNLIATTCYCVTVTSDSATPRILPPSDLVASTPKGRYAVSSARIHPKCSERADQVLIHDYAEVTLKGKVDVFSNVSIARLPAFEKPEDYESQLKKVIDKCHFVLTLTEVGDHGKAKAVHVGFESCKKFFVKACSYTVNQDEDEAKCKEEVQKFQNSSTLCFKVENITNDLHLGSPLICKPGLVWAIATYKDLTAKTVLALKLYQSQFGMSSATFHRFAYKLMILLICCNYMFRN